MTVHFYRNKITSVYPSYNFYYSCKKHITNVDEDIHT